MNPKTTKKYLSIFLSLGLIFSSTFFAFPIQTEAATLTKNKTLSLPTNMTGLVGWWTMDGGDTVWTSSTAATTLDKSGNGNTGTLTSMTQSIATTPGKIGQGLKFDGSNDYVTKQNMINLGGDFSGSISFWAKGSGAVISNERAGNNATGNRHGYVSINSNGSMKYGIYTKNSPPYIYSVTSDTTADVTTWNHYVAVINATASGNTQILYVNGTSSSKVLAYVTDGNDAHYKNVDIGRYRDSSYSTGLFTGSLDDVRIYNRALSTAEITALYNTGTASHFNVTPKTVQSGLVGHWTFDGKDTPWTSSSAATAVDRSGNGNTGTLTSMTQSIATTPGKIGQGLNFDGVNDYVTTSNTFTPTDTFTASAWTYVDSFTGTYNTVFSTRTYDPGDNFGIWAQNNLRWYIQMFGSGVDVSNFSVSMETKKWYHVVLVKSLVSPYVRFYVNGVLVFSSSSNPGTLTSRQLDAGTYSTTSGPLKGKVDDLRIYNRALTESEIMQLYNLGR